jgi:hypothetical protein
MSAAGPQKQLYGGAVVGAVAGDYGAYRLRVAGPAWNRVRVPLKRSDRMKSVGVPPSRLYLDDLNDLLAVLAPLGEVEITADDYQADTLDDLLSLPAKPLRKLKLDIVCLNGIMITIDRGSGLLIPSGKSTEVKAALGDIQAIFSRRRRRVAGLLASQWFTVLASVGALVFGIIGVVNWAQKVHNLALSAALAILVIVNLGIVIGSALISFRFYSVIIPRYRRDSSGFWVRNKDNLIVALASTLLGAILGVVGTLVAQALSGH